MIPTNRFEHLHDETARALLEGASRVKMEAWSLGGELHVTYEVHGTLPDSATARRVWRDVLEQIATNAQREGNCDDCDCGGGAP